MARARELRKNKSLPEKMLWSRLRNKKLGYVIRNQYTHGPYVMDFYVHHVRMCIEIDGKAHEMRVEKDIARDEYFAKHQIETIRFSAQGVLRNVDEIAEIIYHMICDRCGEDPLGIRRVNGS